MISFLILLSWITILAAMAGRRQKRPKLLLPGQVDEQFRAAQAKSDHVALVQYYRLALERPLPEKEVQLIRINLAYSLTCLGDYDQALQVLDQVQLKLLMPHQVVLWLNNRAYNLLKLHRFEEALDHLQDAQELFLGDDGLSKDAALASSIHSTRGMIFLGMGELDKAEKSLELALRFESDQAAVTFDNIHEQGDPTRTAERYYWLSEISRRRGNLTEATLRLQKAARFPFTEYGNKALVLLRSSTKALSLIEPEEQSRHPNFSKEEKAEESFTVNVRKVQPLS